MGKKDLVIRSAFLVTKEKLPDRFLFTGKVERENSAGGFLFYLFEILSPWSSVSRIKKHVLETLEKNLLKNELSEDFFEKVVNETNESLNNISESGGTEWIGNLNAVIGMVFDNKIFLTQSGKISGYIFRNTKISTLTENPSVANPDPLRSFSEIISGDLIENDKIVFGNTQLYNHLSLDRIRRITQNLTAKESILELYRDLRKFKIENVNSVIIESVGVASAENEISSALPEIIYLDQAKESLVALAKKHLGPKLKICMEKGSRYGGKAWTLTKKHGGIALKHSKVYWKNRLGPKTKAILKKGGHKAEEAFVSAKSSIKPQIEKIKEQKQYKNIRVKTKLYTNSTTSRFNDFINYISAATRQIIKLFGIKNYRKYFYLVFILILLFSGYLKIRANNIHRDEIKAQEQITTAYDKASEIYNKAKEDIALGRISNTKEMNEALALAEKAKESPPNKNRSEELIREIHQSIDKIEKIERFYDVQPKFRLGNSINRFVLAGADIVGVDSDGKIYSGNVRDNDAKLLGSVEKESGEILDLSYSESEQKIYVRTGTGKMLAFDLNSKTSSEMKMADPAENWENSSKIDSFVSNIYLLDKDKNNILKHTKQDDEYSKGTIYVDAKKAALKDSVDFVVDGNIYILNSDGSVKKFSKGTLDPNFSIRNIPGSGKIEAPSKIFTGEENNYIYILDGKTNKIIRFDKNGEFISQYALDKITIDDFSANDKIKKAWVLSGGDIYEFDL